jgi:hypothetical protein
MYIVMCRFCACSHSFLNNHLSQVYVNTFILEIPLEEFLTLEKQAASAKEFGIEILGKVGFA